MEVASYVLGIASVILFAVAAFVGLYGHHKKSAAWLTTGGICLVVVAANCWFLEREEKRELSGPTESPDLLVPSNDPTPPLSIPPGRPLNVPASAVTVAQDEITLLFGDFGVSTAESTFVVLRLYEKDLLTISRKKAA